MTGAPDLHIRLSSTEAHLCSQLIFERPETFNYSVCFEQSFDPTIRLQMESLLRCCQNPIPVMVTAHQHFFTVFFISN